MGLGLQGLGLRVANALGSQDLWIGPKDDTM